jgi:uncharacterized membrane protein
VGQLNKAFRLATASPGGVHWLLRRNCSVTPRQSMAVFLSLCVVSLVLSGFFWFQGAPLVLPFALLELLAVGVAFLVHARHATDRECISLWDGCLVVEQERAGRLRRSEFARHTVRVEMPSDADRLVEVHGGGRRVQVGRFLRAELRPVLAREIRAALQA